MYLKSLQSRWPCPGANSWVLWPGPRACSSARASCRPPVPTSAPTQVLFRVASPLLAISTKGGGPVDHHRLQLLRRLLPSPRWSMQSSWPNCSSALPVTLHRPLQTRFLVRPKLLTRRYPLPMGRDIPHSLLVA